jgi:hypothetical protein
VGVGAFGLRWSSGIGSGHGAAEPSIVNSILISGGVINATGNMGAGIGAGFARNGNSTVRRIWFQNTPKITARATTGSVIGAGYGNSGNSHVDSIIIHYAQFPLVSPPSETRRLTLF